MKVKDSDILIVPGYGGSDPDHWQTRWERRFDNCHRVDLGLWETPNRNAWVNRLNLEIHRTAQPTILVAHSLGCHLVAWWAAMEKPDPSGPVIGALLVAPPEVDAGIDDRWLSGFAPAPRSPLPFRSTLVASRNDGWCSFDRARRLASFWDSQFVDAGEAGHINAESDIGEWVQGQQLVSQLAAGPQRGDIRTTALGVPLPDPSLAELSVNL